MSRSRAVRTYSHPWSHVSGTLQSALMTVFLIVVMLFLLSLVIPTASTWLSIRFSFEDFLAFAGIVATIVLTSAVADFASQVRMAGSSAQRAHFSAVSVFPEIAATVAAFGLDVAGLLCMLSLLVIEWGSQASLARYLVVIVVCVAVSMFASLRPSLRAGNLLPRNLARQRAALEHLRHATTRRRALAARVSRSPLPAGPRSAAVTFATVVVAVLPGLLVARSTSPADAMLLATVLSFALPVTALAICQGVFGPSGRATVPIILLGVFFFVIPKPPAFAEAFGWPAAGYDVMPSIVAWACSAALLIAAYLVERNGPVRVIRPVPLITHAELTSARRIQRRFARRIARLRLDALAMRVDLARVVGD